MAPGKNFISPAAVRVQPGRRCKEEGSPPSRRRTQPLRSCNGRISSSSSSSNRNSPPVVTRRQCAMRGRSPRELPRSTFNGCSTRTRNSHPMETRRETERRRRSRGPPRSSPNGSGRTRRNGQATRESPGPSQSRILSALQSLRRMRSPEDERRRRVITRSRSPVPRRGLIVVRPSHLSNRELIEKLYGKLADYKGIVDELKQRKEEIFMRKKQRAEGQLQRGTLDRQQYGQVMSRVAREEQISLPLFTSLEADVDIMRHNTRLLERL